MVAILPQYFSCLRTCEGVRCEGLKIGGRGGVAKGRHCIQKLKLNYMAGITTMWLINSLCTILMPQQVCDTVKVMSHSTICQDNTWSNCE